LVSNSKKLDVLTKAKTDKNLPLYYLLNQKLVDIEILRTY